MKIALDMEIAVFRRLIENEEDRLDLSMDVSPSKSIRRRRSSSSSSSGSSSDEERKGKKEKETWGANKDFVDGKATVGAGATVTASKTTVVSASVASQSAAQKSKQSKK